MEKRDERRFIYRIDKQDRVIHVNQEWLDFARENQAPELSRAAVRGRKLNDFIADRETRHLYDIIYRRCRETGEPTEVSFRCDSPAERRLQKLHIRRHGERGELEFEGHIISIEARRPYTLSQHSGEDRARFLVICSWCKKIRVGEDRWVEMEEAAKIDHLFDAVPPNLSHGICPQCFAQVRREVDKQ